jgi:thiol-disulfide isomerase/thioredoxin
MDGNTSGETAEASTNDRVAELLSRYRVYQDLSQEWPPKEIEFKSQADRDTATLAWYLLKQLDTKIAPATDMELGPARQRGYEGGLRIVREDGRPSILVQLQGKKIAGFNDLRNTLIEIAIANPEVITLKAMMGTVETDYGIVRESSASSRFPSLEEQKLADVVYRQLGLELEPLTADELKRVRALGFEGGMKVSLNDGSVISWERNRAGIVPNDILVGLHVWPTKSAADVVAVLERDDLAELNPLKYYAVRPGEPSGGGFGPEHPEPDTIGTGRITVKVPAAKLHPTVPSSVPRQSTAGGTSATDTQLAPGMKEVREERVNPETGKTQTIITVHPESQPVSPAPRPTLTPAPYRPGIEPVDVSSLPIPTDVQQALRERGPLTVALFYGENSAPCQEMRKMLQEFERTHLSLPVVFDAKSVEMNRQAAIRYGIERVPTLIWLRDDEVVNRSVGALSLDEFGGHLFAVARALSERKTAPPKLLYDGKTFDQWRSAWKTELSMENRLEAVKALSAFGANGNGKEAAEAIMEVAQQQDWSYIDNSSAGKLRQACVDAFTTGQTTGGYRIPAQNWFPLVKPLIAKQGEKFNFATYIQVPRGEKVLIPELVELTKDPATKNWGMWGLKNVDPAFEDERTLAYFLQRLQETKDNPQELSLALRSFLYSPNGSMISIGQSDTELRYVPELKEYLFHPDEQVQQSARYVFTWILPKDGEGVVKDLLKVIEDENESNRVSAIRALAAIGPKARAAEKKLLQITQEQLVKKTADEAFFAAIVALMRLEGSTLEWENEVCERIFGHDSWKNFSEPWMVKAIGNESENLFPAETQRTLGGGGGMF